MPGGCPRSPRGGTGGSRCTTGSGILICPARGSWAPSSARAAAAAAGGSRPAHVPRKGFTGAVMGFGGPCSVVAVAAVCPAVPSCAQLLQVRAARMRATEPQFLGAGDKDLLVSRCCRVSSCCRTSSSPSLILGSPWGMGSAQPAPPSFGVPAPVSVPRGQWDRAVGRAAFPLPRYLCHQLLAPRWGHCGSLGSASASDPAGRPGRSLPSPEFHAWSFVPGSLLQHFPPPTQTPLKLKLEQNRHLGGWDLARGDLGAAEPEHAGGGGEPRHRPDLAPTPPGTFIPSQPTPGRVWGLFLLLFF